VADAGLVDVVGDVAGGRVVVADGTVVSVVVEEDSVGPRTIVVEEAAGPGSPLTHAESTRSQSETCGENLIAAL
jgi:hypothetical protein